MDVERVMTQILDLLNHPSSHFNREPMIRDILLNANRNDQSTTVEALRQRTEEVDAFHKSAEFWRSQFLAQADALRGFEPKAIEMKIVDLEK